MGVKHQSWFHGQITFINNTGSSLPPFKAPDITAETCGVRDNYLMSCLAAFYVYYHTCLSVCLCLSVHFFTHAHSEQGKVVGLCVHICMCLCEPKIFGELGLVNLPQLVAVDFSRDCTEENYRDCM